MLIGLTGNSGSGKSTVAAIFAEAGYYVIDCDRVVHEEVYRSPEVLAAIARAFGPELVVNHKLNRALLRARTMGDSQATALLNQTVLPFIVEHIQKIINAHRVQPVLLDAPTLFESGMDRACDYIIGVTAPAPLLIKRITERDGLTRTEAKKRLSSQHTEEFFKERCDYMIYNSGSLQALRRQAKSVLGDIHGKAL